MVRLLVPLLMVTLFVVIIMIFGCEAEPRIIAPSQETPSFHNTLSEATATHIKNEFSTPTLKAWHLYEAVILDVEIPDEHADEAFTASLLDDFSVPIVDSAVMERFTVTVDEAMGPEDVFSFARNPKWFDSHIGNMKWFGIFTEYTSGDQTFIPFVWMRMGYTLSDFSSDLAASGGFAPDNLRLDVKNGFAPELLFQEAPGIESFQGALYEVKISVETEKADGEDVAETSVTRFTAFAQLHPDKPFTRYVPLKGATAGGSAVFRIRPVWLINDSDNELTGTWSERVTLPITTPTPELEE